MSRSNVSRRQFLQTSAAGGLAALSGPAILSAQTQKTELHVAAIGANGMGWADLSNVGSHSKVKFVGFCDVDTARFDKVDEKFPGVPHYADYREMIDALGNKLDAVIVSTPDHMHAPAAMYAMNRGKHCLSDPQPPTIGTRSSSTVSSSRIAVLTETVPLVGTYRRASCARPRTS